MFIRAFRAFCCDNGLGVLGLLRFSDFSVLVFQGLGFSGLLGFRVLRV